MRLSQMDGGGRVVSLRHSAAGPGMRSRYAYADNLKVVLVVGVIVAHATMAWTGVGTWVFDEPHVHEPLLTLAILLEVMGALFGMALFFFIAGVFTPGSLTRKGLGRPDVVPGRAPALLCGVCHRANGVATADYWGDPTPRLAAGDRRHQGRTRNRRSAVRRSPWGRALASWARAGAGVGRRLHTWRHRHGTRMDRPGRPMDGAPGPGRSTDGAGRVCRRHGRRERDGDRH